MRFPKPAREENAEHLAYVRHLPCCVPDCTGPGRTDPHHVVRRSLGGSDFYTVPLCRQHHMELHGPRGERRFWADRGLTRWEEVSKVLRTCCNG